MELVLISSTAIGLLFAALFTKLEEQQQKKLAMRRLPVETKRKRNRRG